VHDNVTVASYDDADTNSDGKCYYIDVCVDADNARMMPWQLLRADEIVDAMF
jgi:hypothetical protein